jgi:hypothetical protein
MPDSELKGSKNLPVPIEEVKPEPVEVEFTELPKSPSNQYWPHVLTACGIAVGIYWMFFSGPSTDLARTTTAPAVAGWDELGACSSVASLDGMKQLSFLPNGGANFSDDSPQKDGDATKDRSINGYWRLNEGSKRYTVTLKGENESYLLVTSEHAPVCILIKGDIGAADLRESWFSSPVVDDDPGDYEMPDRR